METRIEQLKQAYETLDQEKSRLRDMNKMVKEGCESYEGYNETTEEMKKLRLERKVIKDQVIDDLQLRADIEESKETIALQKEIIAHATVSLIKEGGDPNKEIEVGEFTITPSVKISYKKQLTLNI